MTDQPRVEHKHYLHTDKEAKQENKSVWLNGKHLERTNQWGKLQKTTNHDARQETVQKSTKHTGRI